MAKLGSLVVNIGANTKDLNKKLGAVQRKMKRVGSNFKKLGSSLSRSITLPLLGVAAMAVKSAADLETLETSFVSLTGGVKQAADMMKNLNEFTAKTPFQIDAVATSARQLIASGTKLSEVNETLQFLGDIAATSGRPINELAEIFAKVNAKGKVSLMDLNQLAMKGIPAFTGLAKATGKLPSELGAGGVTVQQFNDYLRSLSEEGGMANGAMERLSKTASGKFSTALDNLKLAGAALADSLLPIISDLLDKVVELAQSFVALSPATKKLILIFGGVAAALGPLLMIIPGIAAALPLLGSAFVAMTGPLGIVVVSVTALITAFAAIVRANKDIPSSLEKANAAVRDHSVEVRYLVGQYKDETKSLKDRQTILSRLATIDAAHFGNLQAESTTYTDLVKNLDAYTASLRKNYLEKSFSEQGEALFGTLADDEAAIREEQIMNQRMRDVLEDANRFTESAAKENVRLSNVRLRFAEKTRDKTLKDIEAFEEEKVRLLEKYATTKKTPETKDNEIDTVVVITPKVDLEELPTAGSLDSLRANVELLTDKINGLKLGTDEYMATQLDLTAATLLLDDAIASMSPTLKLVEDDVSSVLNELSNFEIAAEETAESVADSVSGMAQNISDEINRAVASMVSGLAEMVGAAIGSQKPIENVGAFIGGALAQMAINLGEYAIFHGLTIIAIKESLESLNGYLVVAAGIALVALGSTVKASLAKSASDAGIPALAEGGLAYGPTLAMVGDNKGANIDPEVVAPLSKLKGMLGGNSVQVYGRISGDDIVISNSRASRDRNRF